MSAKKLRVVERDGGFFHDDFFRDSWQNFDSAMQSVLDKHDPRGKHKVERENRDKCHDAYRAIRKSKIDGDVYEAQALSMQEKNGGFQAVMDVKDFNPRELQVRAIDDRIVVEGKYEKRSEDGKTTTAKAFYREITVPETAEIDCVSTALSKDGVLTVKAPKRVGYSPPRLPQTSAAAAKAYRAGHLDQLSDDVQQRMTFDPRSGVASPAFSDATHKSEVQFNVGQNPMSPPPPSETGTFPSLSSVSIPSMSSLPTSPSQTPTPTPQQYQSRPTLTGGDTTVSVREDGGIRTVTTEAASQVEEKDGFMKTRERNAEETGDGGHTKRREASTTMARKEEDPEGKFKRSHTADAKEMSESSVKELPDGSKMSVQRSSVSSSSVSESFSHGGGGMPGFGDMMSAREMMMPGFGRGPSLFSRMESDFNSGGMLRSSSNHTSDFDDFGNSAFPKSNFSKNSTQSSHEASSSTDPNNPFSSRSTKHSSSTSSFSSTRKSSNMSDF